MTLETDPIEIPDFLGHAGRVQSISQILEEAQANIIHTENLRQVNGHGHDDKMPRSDLTYAEATKRLLEGQRALLEANGDIPDLRDRLISEAFRSRSARGF